MIHYAKRYSSTHLKQKSEHLHLQVFAFLFVIRNVSKPIALGSPH